RSSSWGTFRAGFCSVQNPVFFSGCDAFLLCRFDRKYLWRFGIPVAPGWFEESC
ncbi:hypothetical protein pipiens_016195, partial [Culex pipiens pipiens]